MRHAKRRLQLNRFTSWYKATLRSMSANLLRYQSTKTTLAKAKALQPYFERLIGLAKKNTLAAKRDAFAILADHKLVTLLFNEIGPRFASRTSGFTRIIPLKRRRGDNAQIVIFELTEIEKKEAKKHKKDKEEKKEERKELAKEKPTEEKKPDSTTTTAVKLKPPATKKPTKKFFGGLRNIFKKERDSL